MNRPPPVIAIDGPAGSGKGTVAKGVASRLGWGLLDSGALYRIVALTALRRGIDLADAPALAAMATRLRIAFADTTALVDDADVTEAIRAPQIDAPASTVAALPAVRAALLDVQRGFRRPPGLVADGRDMGTVVFPDAALKIFLDASPEARAERRLEQLRQRAANAAPSATVAALRAAMRERDERDRQRAIAPLVPAADAVVIDSTALSAGGVIEQVLTLAHGRMAHGGCD